LSSRELLTSLVVWGRFVGKDPTLHVGEDIAFLPLPPHGVWAVRDYTS
jgi:hypothetical protein